MTIMTTKSTTKLNKLSKGDHACFLYNDLKEYRKFSVDFIIEGLLNNEMVHCTIEEYPKELLIQDLIDQNIDIEYFIDTGQLVISSIKDIYYGNQGFHPDDTIKYCINNFDKVKTKKFHGIRGLGEMLFALDGRQESIDKLIEYEINYGLQVMPIYTNHQYLCIYNKNLFPSSVLKEIIKAHDVVIDGTRLTKPNPYFKDPHKHLKEYQNEKSLKKYFYLDKVNNISPISHEDEKAIKDFNILKHILSATGDGVWEWDVLSNQIYFNQCFYDITGYKKKEIEGDAHNIKEFIHSEDIAEFIKKVNKCKNNEIQHIEYEIRVVTKEGEILWFIVKGTPITKDENGQVVKIVGIFNNITESKNTKIELSTVLRATADAILVIDSKEQVLHYNEKFLAMFEISESLLENKEGILVTEYIRNMFADPTMIIDIKEKNVQNNKEILDIIQLKDGRIIERFYKPFYLYSRERCHAYGFRDISERKRAEKLEQEIILKQKELKEVRKYERLKTEIFSTISHELKTPLNIILGTTQLLSYKRKQGELNEESQQDRYIHIMRQNCYRLLRLINNLIDINKLDSGFMKLELKNYNIVSMIENITLSIVEYVESKNITLIFDTDVEEKIMAFDGDKIERVLLNLLSNAVKFTEEKGEIFVNIYDKGEHIIISVKDTGVGIPVEMQKKVFERFSQVESPFSRIAEGSGIGLSLVKSIVELHGGNIILKSEYGKGSEFIINLPVTKVNNDRIVNNRDPIKGEENIERIHIEFSDIYS
ncbi:ATP-binding protein [Irregularibacter muris]|uniref:histidine kinase n=2 Tax=Irregularibacter muris TaxID=1796619 RepID=A0AAE3L3A1_9FIRM|nr:ATP-binding protein [Irregularibacter muris]